MKGNGLAVAHIDAGACGYATSAKAISEDGRRVSLEITSDCPNIQLVAANLRAVDVVEEISWRRGKRTIIDAMAAHSRHTACPVGSGIIKAVEVCAGLAVPADVAIKVMRGDGLG